MNVELTIDQLNLAIGCINTALRDVKTEYEDTNIDENEYNTCTDSLVSLRDRFFIARIK